jgi:GT2 family glycosyltransferase
MPHLLIVRKTIGDQVGWLREGFEGAQDYDFILRLIEKTQNIVHIPKILYHWREWGKSTASSTETKPYAEVAGKKALQEHIDRIGLTATVEAGYSSTRYRIQYQLPINPLVSIIIPNQDHPADLKLCVDSILQKTTYSNFEILVAENGSQENETLMLYEKLKQIQKLRIVNWEQPFNYSSINNWAVEQANGQVLLFLNNDTQVINGNWLEEMLQFALRSDVGAVGAKLYYQDGTIQNGGIILGIGGIAGHSHKYFPKNHRGYFGQLALPHNVSAVTGACLMIRKQVFQEVGGFDKNFPVAYGDVDLCLRVLQKGYLNVWTPYAELYHFESKTRGYKDADKRSNQEMIHFKQKWSLFLDTGDPYYNPNLTLSSEDFGINPNQVQAKARAYQSSTGDASK